MSKPPSKLAPKPPSIAPWLTQAATVLSGALLAFNIVFDALSPAYQGAEVTFGLLGLFGGLLGLHKSLRGGGES